MTGRGAYHISGTFEVDLHDFLDAQRFEGARISANAFTQSILVKSYTLEFLSESRRNLGFVCLGAVAFVLLIARTIPGPAVPW